jgi:hypothetical protein
MTVDLRHSIQGAVNELAPPTQDPATIADSVLQRVAAQRLEVPEPHRPRRTLVALAAVVVAIAALTAVMTRPEPGSRTADQVALREGDNAWPVGQEWRYRVPWASPHKLFERQFTLFQTAIQVCMRDQGLGYEPAPYVNDDAIRSLNPLHPAAVEAGYHDPPGHDGTGDPTRTTGTNTGAAGDCSNRAFTFVYEAPAATAFSATHDNLTPAVDRAIGTFQQSTIGVERVADWAACMRSKGHDFTSPEDAREQFSATPAPTDRERKVRRDDYECDVAVSLTETRSRYEQAALESWLTDNADAVQDAENALASAGRELSELEDTLTRRGVAALNEP